MNKKLLITFGCSWTSGFGVGHRPDMSIKQFLEIAEDKQYCDQLSYRQILAKKFGYENKNFAHGKSSNQKQFFLAKKYFSSLEHKEDLATYSSIVVIHAITSTARNYVYSSVLGQMFNIIYNDMLHSPLTKCLLQMYNHDNEIDLLTTEMSFWNEFYKSKNIKNYWIDTYNHHKYTAPIDNLMAENLPHRDLLSLLALKNGLPEINNTLYHQALWKNESSQVNFLINKGILNPISKHPTVAGHQQIADILSGFLDL